MKYTLKTNHKRIFVDTSSWVEFVLEKERYHQQVFDYFAVETSALSHFFTSDYVLDETYTRLLTRQSITAAKKFKQVVEKSERNKELSVLFTTKAVFDRSWNFFEKFSEHQSSFTDATIYTFVKDLKINEVLTLDQGFKKIGLIVKPDIDLK